MATHFRIAVRPASPRLRSGLLSGLQAGLLAVAGILLMPAAHAQSKAPGQSGLSQAAPPSQVPPCSWTPNCVSSNGKPGESKYFAPLRPKAGEKEPMRRLKGLVSSLPGAKLVVEQPFLLRYEFTTERMKFIDDVQFTFIPATGLIEVRSASRVGISDFGVNRDRMDKVRSLFEK